MLYFCVQYGPVFSFTMVGKTFTYLVGSQAAALFFNSRNENLNAEEVYSRLTTPVFGKGVAYDCPHPVCIHFASAVKLGGCLLFVQLWCVRNRLFQWLSLRDTHCLIVCKGIERNIQFFLVLHTHMHTHTCTHMHARTHMHTLTHTHTHAHVHACMHKHTHTHTHAHTCTHTHLYALMCTH